MNSENSFNFMFFHRNMIHSWTKFKTNSKLQKRSVTFPKHVAENNYLRLFEVSEGLVVTIQTAGLPTQGDKPEDVRSYYAARGSAVLLLFCSAPTVGIKAGSVSVVLFGGDALLRAQSQLSRTCDTSQIEFQCGSQVG